MMNLNFGDITFILYALFVVVQLWIRGKERSIYDLLQFPLSLAFSRVLNLFDGMILYHSDAHSFFSNLLLLLLAILLTGMGAAMTVNMRLVPNPGDGIVAALAQRFGREQGYMKNIFDVGCVSVTCVIGLAVSGRIVGIGIGTLVAMLGVGRAISLTNHLFREKMCRSAGLPQTALKHT